MMNKLTEAIKHLIIINVLLFIAPKLVDFDLQGLFALHFPQNPNFGLWQFITHMFMHSQFSFMHILFNMYALWAFGTPLEQMWGRNKFLFFYFSAGLGAGIIYTLVNYYQFNSAFNELINLGASSEEIYSLMNPTVRYENEILQKANEIYSTPAVGASGAVYGILVAFGMTFPNAKLGLIFFPVPVAAKYFIPGLILLDLFSGVTGFSLFGGGVAHFAHVGGALIGFLIAYYWKQNQFNRWN